MDKIIVLFIPVFLILLGLEAFMSYRQKKGFYKLKDSFGNLGTGIMNQLVNVFVKAPMVVIFLYIQKNFNILDKLGINFWSDDIATVQGVVSWVVVFLLADLVYYFYHRHSHEVNILWAAHSVHHSSEEYNLSVALRQSSLAWAVNLFYSVFVAVLGVPPHMFFFCFGLNLIYQFWIHTRYIKNMGPFELVFNSPSHHRVHHARQGKYLDCNYAGILIIWDRMFGTFIKEEEEPKYGVFPRFQSYDPLRANVHPLKELFVYAREARGLDKVRVFFKGPLWLYENFKKGKNLNILEKERPASTRSKWLFAGAMGLTLPVLFLPTLTVPTQVVLVIMVFVFLGWMGQILDS